MAELNRGVRIGPWIVVRTLGKGSFGITYLARHAHPKLEHLLVAIKEFYPADLVSRRDDGSIAVTRKAEPQFKQEQQQFLEEVAAVARVDHVNIVGVHDFIVANGTSYMVMRLARGPSLLAKVGSKKAGTLHVYDVPALKAMLVQLLDALDTLHSARPPLLHRDIKPQNIIINERDERPILLDFGAARQFSAELSQKMTAILTRGYAPYEQYTLSEEEFEDEYEDLKAENLRSLPRQGAPTDLYALGAVCHFALTGVPPRDSLRRKLGSTTYTPLEDRVSGSKPFLRLIDRALAIEPADRFSNAREWLDEIARIDLNDVDPRAVSPESSPPPRPVSPASSQRSSYAASAWPQGTEPPPKAPSTPSPAVAPTKPATAMSHWPPLLILLAILIVPIVIAIASQGPSDSAVNDSYNYMMENIAAEENATDLIMNEPEPVMNVTVNDAIIDDDMMINAFDSNMMEGNAM